MYIKSINAEIVLKEFQNVKGQMYYSRFHRESKCAEKIKKVDKNNINESGGLLVEYYLGLCTSWIEKIEIMSKNDDKKDQEVIKTITNEDEIFNTLSLIRSTELALLKNAADKAADKDEAEAEKKTDS